MVNKINSIYECPFDVHLLNFIDTHLGFYYMIGLTPNIITTIGIIFGILSMVSIFNNKFLYGSIFLLIAYYFDCVDGKLARKYNMQTSFGDYYDHFGDIFKIIIILYALYKINSKLFIKITPIMIILCIIMFIHLGLQENIYNKQESPTLNCFKMIASIFPNPKVAIQYTKYCGCGTFILFLVITILFWTQ